MLLFNKMFILDLAPVPARDYLVKVSAAGFLANAIYNAHHNLPVSPLFGDGGE